MTTEVPSPRERAAMTKRTRTQERLLTAARTLFEKRGIETPRLEDIASLAGVGATTAYTHFGSKQQLVHAVYLPLLEPLVDSAQAELEHNANPTEAVREIVLRFTNLLLANRNLTVVLHDLPKASVSEETSALPRFIQALSALVEKARPTEYGSRPYSASDAVTYHVHALVALVASRPDPDERLYAIIESQLISTLLPKTPRQ